LSKILIALGRNGFRDVVDFESPPQSPAKISDAVKRAMTTSLSRFNTCGTELTA